MGRTADPMPFSPQYAFEVFRAMKYDNHDYVRGDAFPAEGQPAVPEPMLRKLYNQKRIIVAFAPDAADLKPGTVQAADEAARLAKLAESAKGDGQQESQDAADDEDETSGSDDTATETDASSDGEDAAADDSEQQQRAGDAGDGSEPAGPGGVGESTDGEKPAETVPTGPLKREHRGFGKHDVVSANGVILHTELSKGAADALVAKGL
jgi:hypothetical protein